MGIKNDVSKQYLADNAIFADICNFYVYHGKQIIQPNQLYPLDVTASITLDNTDNSVWSTEKQRDVLKYAEADNTAYLIVGIESQSNIHYAMPVRNMLYDAIQYAHQMQEKEKSLQNTTNKKNNTEHASTLHNHDSLIPVVTIVLYLGSKPWNGPRSLHEMLKGVSPEILQYVADYKIQLIAPQELTDEELSMFHSNLQQVLKFIKYQKDKVKMNILMHSDEYAALDKAAIRVINAFTHLKLKPHYIDKEESNMCQAWDEHYEDGRNEGITIGLDKGRDERSKEMALALLKKDILPLAEIAELTKLPLTEIEALQAAI